MILSKNIDKTLSILFLAFDIGLLNGVTKVALGVWLRNLGMNIINLGLLNITYIPITLRVFWAPFLDNMRTSIFNYSHRKSMIIILCALITLSFNILVLSSRFNITNPNDPYFTLFIFSFLFFFSVLLVTKESMLVAYEMEILTEKEWGSIQGKTGMFYNIGVWGGGAFLLFCSMYAKWSTLFFVIEIYNIISLGIHLLLPDSTTIKPIQHKTMSSTLFAPWKEFFNKNKGYVLYILLFIMFYRLQDRLLMGISTYFFMEQGLNNVDLSGLKTFGAIVMTMGGFLSSRLIGKIGYINTLSLGIILQVVSAVGFIAQCYLGHSMPLTIANTFLEKIGRGFEGCIFLASQRFFCSPRFLLGQIAILSTFDRGFSAILSSFSGYAVYYLGWPMFFAISALSIFPAIYLLYKLPKFKNNDIDLCKDQKAQ